MKIIETESVGASEIRYLNDAAEFEYGPGDCCESCGKPVIVAWRGQIVSR